MENIGKIIEILQAFKEGKTIEYFVKFKDESYEWRTLTNTKDILDCIYKEFKVRIKKEPTYRPYANAEEFLRASKEHGPYIITQTYIKEGVIGETYCNIPNEVSNIGIKFNFDHLLFYWNRLLYDKELGLRTFVWQDGTPCGILEE